MTHIYITDEAERKLSAYLRLADDEISGFGLLEQEDGLITVNEIFILPQEASSGHTELDTEALHDLLNELLDRGVAPETVGLWWHSHGDFRAYFSETDEDTIERFADLGRPWMISLVSNHDLDHNIRVDFYEPMRAVVEDVELRRFSRTSESFDRRILAEIRQKVRLPAPMQPSARFKPYEQDEELMSFLERHYKVMD